MEEINQKDMWRMHWFFGLTVVCVASPDIYKRITVMNNKNYSKPTFAYQKLKAGIGDGLVTLNGDEHAVQRKLCMGAFKYSVLKALVDKFEKHSKELVEIWGDKLADCEYLDLFIEDDLKGAALDSITDACFDLKTSVLHDRNSDVTRAMRRLMERTTIDLKSFIPFYKYIPTAENRRFNRDKELVDNIVYDMINKKKEYIKTIKDDSKVSDLLTMLLLAEDEDGTKMTETQVRDHMLTFMFAGHDTSSITMVWCLWSLAHNPEVQRKVRSEIFSVLPSVDEPVKADHLERMPYLLCVLKETLRLHTIVPVTVRIALNDDYINGYLIPKGTFIFLLVSTIHNSPDYWKDPDMFIPERFEDETKIKPFTFIPFTSGPRMCIGFKLALMEIQVFLANLLRRYEFSLSPEMTEVGKKFQSTQCPDKPMMLRVTKLRL